jgi:hypothetical protein
VWLWVSVVAVAAMAAADEATPVNGGFERLEAGGAITGWTLDPTGSTAGATATAATSPVHTGVGSLRLDVATTGQATAVSDPVSLEVGRAYRLIAWVRTADAVADPTARYPTALPAAVAMASFPFTEHSGAVGGSRDWTRVETEFFATRAEDRVRLHLGLNGTARGVAWFDDVRLEPVASLDDMVPPVTVRHEGPGFRYDDRGWIHLHVEGSPYDRGWQHGTLVGDEIVSYLSKLAVLANEADPEAGWARLRFEADALFRRRFDPELQLEMQGIADGAAHAGAMWDGRPLDQLDIVTLNSAVDLGQLEDALEVTPDGLTGERFDLPEEELGLAPERHHCSAFTATAPATADGGVVFGQIFMWAGYTGAHWNVLIDLEPERGHRLEFQTFPGGIHSGADFYLNDAGVVFGETTVAQTQWDSEGTPQSDRARRAAQYASSIDDVVRILSDGNNGLYTNDWPMADIGSGEAAILLLGTHHQRLWRTTEDPAPFGLPGFLYSNNNPRDPAVRRELTRRPDGRPVDPVFSPWNRDLAFRDFYRDHAGRIDVPAAARLFGSSPINRVHACDGKLTDSEMATRLVFLAHHGKTTLRSKFPRPGWRVMPDLPDARPHLSLGWSTVSPLVVAEAVSHQPPTDSEVTQADVEIGPDIDVPDVDPMRLWHDTVLPATDGDSWFASASATYWRMLEDVEGSSPKERVMAMADLLGTENARLLWTLSREPDVAPLAAHPALDRTAPWVVSRVKGVFALHQLHLLVGTETFLDVMGAIHDRYHDRAASTDEILGLADEVAGRPVAAFVRQWLEREGLPVLSPEIHLRRARGKWEVAVQQPPSAGSWHLVTSLEIVTPGARTLRRIELVGSRPATITVDEAPERIIVNPLWDVAVAHSNYGVWRNQIDDFDHLRVVYGSARHTDFSRDMADRWSARLADIYTEILPPVVSDAELDDALLAASDVVLLDVGGDNGTVARLAESLPLELGRNHFGFRGRVHGDPDEGVIVVVPNPLNPKRMLYLVRANSGLELERMTRSFDRDLRSWAVFRGGDVVDGGFFDPVTWTARDDG